MCAPEDRDHDQMHNLPRKRVPFMRLVPGRAGTGLAIGWLDQKPVLATRT